MSGHTFGSLISLGLALASPLAASGADPCDALYDTAIKSLQTPHHVYSTTRLTAGTVRSGEAIYAGGVEYVQMNGKWQRSPLTVQEMLENAQEKLKTHPETCTLVGDQNAGGQAVSVYRIRNKESGAEELVRILKSSGLMQGATVTLPNGSVMETRYEYSNVRAPTAP